MDKELAFGDGARLYEGVNELDTNFDGLLEDGAIILCHSGAATINVNYKLWSLPSNSVMTFFPGDVITIDSVTKDFNADLLVFSPAILREASLDMEQTVYSALREDRCRGDSTIVTDIVGSMFNLLKAYFRQPGCTCLNRLAMLQLKSFFLGFHDYLIRFPKMRPDESGSKRKRSLFNDFMMLVERDYRKYREVSYYSGLLNISPKYLNIIAKMFTEHNAKTIIDHYVILKLKGELVSSDKPVKQIAWDYSFSDASFFTRYFKQHTGLVPLEYRRNAVTEKQ